MTISSKQVLEFIPKLLEQKERLIFKYPKLKNYFIDIEVEKWGQTLPFLPIRCFRDFDLHATYNPEKPDPSFKIFLSSGSTGNKRAHHIFSPEALQRYTQETVKGFENFLLNNGLSKSTPVISFVPPAKEWPTSSLAGMLEMFAQNGFQIIYCDIDSNPKNFLQSLSKIEVNSQVLLFGTTFHHLGLMKSLTADDTKPLFQKYSLSIVDTGGTKGRTEAIPLADCIQLFQDFYASQKFQFLSEYGMCELSSQAWSLKPIHDSSFICHNTMVPLAISVDKKTALPHGEKGYIAFIDSINEESWGAIITEDIGHTINDFSFYLNGRGPDSSIKGCSLNVRPHFTFEETPEHLNVFPKTQKKNEPFKLSKILDFLQKDKLWDSFFLDDLKTISTSLEDTIPTDKLLQGKSLFIISAANTPIAWFFPYLIAAESGAKSITIKVPSLRLDDYYAQVMTQKTLDLIELVSQFYPEMNTYIDSKKSISRNFNLYDFVLTFGTNETIETIKNQIKNESTVFIGKGDVKNSLKVDVDSESPENIVQLCSLFQGRGCLTPVVLFLEGEKIQAWSQEFANQLEQKFSQRFQSHPVPFMEGFVHAHNCAFLRGQVKQMGLDDLKYISRGQFTCVVKLCDQPVSLLKEFSIELSFGGCGFVYLLPASMEGQISDLQNLSILPRIDEFKMS